MTTEVRKQNKVEVPNVRKAELLKLLGAEEFEAYQEYQAGLQRKAKIAKASEIAKAMVAEGGKYGTRYQELDTQLEAIWQKSLQEARVQVGLPAIDEK